MHGKKTDIHIHALPVELLVDIFRLYLQPEPLHLKVPFLPLILCQICSRWREIMLSSNGHFWRDICICFPLVEGGDDTSPKSLHFVEEFSRRAYPYPLDVTLDVDDCSQAIAAVQAVVPIVDRVEALRIGLPPNEMIGILHLSQNSFPKLKKLQISMNGYPTQFEDKNPYSNPLEMFSPSNAPNLRDVFISEYCGSNLYSEAAVHIPYLQLTNLTLDSMDGSSDSPLNADDALAFFLRCTNLEKCTIQFRGWSDPESNVPPPSNEVTFPALKHLSVTIYDETYSDSEYICGRRLFQSLVLPALETFTFDGCAAILWDDHHDTLMSLKRRSKFPLKKISLEMIHFMEGPDQLRYFLGDIDTLRELKLDRTGDEFEVMEWLNPRTNIIQPPLPNLEHVHLVCEPQGEECDSEAEEEDEIHGPSSDVRSSRRKSKAKVPDWDKMESLAKKIDAFVGCRWQDNVSNCSVAPWKSVTIYLEDLCFVSPISERMRCWNGRGVQTIVGLSEAWH